MRLDAVLDDTGNSALRISLSAPGWRAAAVSLRKLLRARRSRRRCFVAFDGTNNASAAPIRVAQDLTFKDVIAGSGFMVGLTEDGIAYAWGDADRTLLGIESTDTSGRVESPERVAGDHRFAQIYAGTTGRSVPTRIGGALRFERICAGGFEVYAIEADTGRLYEWGMLDRAYNVNDLYVTEPRLSNSRSRASTSRATSPSRRAGACAPS